MWTSSTNLRVLQNAIHRRPCWTISASNDETSTIGLLTQTSIKNIWLVQYLFQQPPIISVEMTELTKSIGQHGLNVPTKFGYVAALRLNGNIPGTPHLYLWSDSLIRLSRWLVPFVLPTTFSLHNHEP